MQGLVFKGELKMNNIGINYERIVLVNQNKELQINDSCNMNKYYETFENNFKLVINDLKELKISPDEWDIPFLIEDAGKMMSDIKCKFIDGKNLDWKIQLSTIFSELTKKSQNNFSHAQTLYEDKLQRCEQYYDLLSNMFSKAEYLISRKYNQYKANKYNSNTIEINRYINNQINRVITVESNKIQIKSKINYMINEYNVVA